jgi:hypothetical protein
VANEPTWELLFDLARDAPNQIVVVEKPLGGLRKRGSTGRARAQLAMGALERSRKRRRFEDMADPSRGALEMLLTFGESARVGFEGGGGCCAVSGFAVCREGHTLSGA